MMRSFLREIFGGWRWVAYASILIAAVQIGFWAFDRKVPYRVVSYETEVKDHDWVSITMQVERDIRKSCNLTMTRWLLDSRGYRWYMPSLSFHPGGIRDLEQQYPGRVAITIDLPESIPDGKTLYRATMRYECNPIHSIWPLVYEQEIEFEVTP